MGLTYRVHKAIYIHSLVKKNLALSRAIIMIEIVTGYKSQVLNGKKNLNKKKFLYILHDVCIAFEGK